MRVVINNGVSDYEFLCPGSFNVGSMKAAISSVLPVQPREMLLYYNGHPLANGALDLCVFHVPGTELRLQLAVTVFVPQ